MGDNRDSKRKKEAWNTSDKVSPAVYKRLIIENAADVIWKVDLRTEKYTYVSSSVLRLTGFTSQEMLGRKMADAFTPESRARLRQLVRRQVAALQRRGIDPPQ